MVLLAASFLILGEDYASINESTYAVIYSVNINHIVGRNVMGWLRQFF